MNLNERENLVLQVEKAKEKIAKLREQQSELERERAELEELKEKQAEWSHGKKEMHDALVKAISILKSEEDNNLRIGELIRGSGGALARILEELEAVKEERWSPSTLKEDLTKALLVIERGRRELSKASARLPALNEKAAAKGAAETGPLRKLPEGIKALSPGEIVKAGFWFTLPFAVMLLVILLLFSLL